MPTLPQLDGQTLDTQGEHLLAACRAVGAFYLANPPIALTVRTEVVHAAQTFFALPHEEKMAVHIEHSPHFRGYSEMHNERDWREQIHFSTESVATSGPAYRRLQGPNLWPASLGERWRNTLLTYLHEVSALGRRLLHLVARTLRLPEDAFTTTKQEPYLLMKLINYHPQAGNAPSRLGVASHCDWSWLTILLQDDVGGLQVCTPNGVWLDVPPLPNTLFVNVGELLEFTTGGYLRATPHRVYNHSAQQPRTSIPIFINPPLDELIRPNLYVGEAAPHTEPEHVHRVLQPHAPRTPFVFGDSEWTRKGLGRWCYAEQCVRRE